MATANLVVELDARTQELEKKLKSVEGKLKGVGTESKNTGAGLKSLSGSAKVVAAGVAGVAVAAAATTVAMVALANKAAAFAREIKVASQLSGMATEKLQLMAYATTTVGIGIEDLGDKFKDSREKVGDFLNTGGGGFMDFVDAMKLTKKEAEAVANEFKHLSGDQILQQMVDRMEEAGVSAVQMSHALEGMASDTTKLIPLLKDGGREMKSLMQAASEVSIPLSDKDIDKFVRMGNSADLAAKSIKSLSDQTLLDLGNAFIRAADLATYFFARMNKGTIEQKTTRLQAIKEEKDALRFGVDGSDDLPKKRGDEGKGSGGTSTGTVDEIQAIRDRFKTEELLLTEKLVNELTIIGDNNADKLNLEAEFVEEYAAIGIKAAEEVAEKKAKLAREDAKIQDLAGKSRIAMEKSIANNALQLTNLVSSDSKAAALAGIVIQKGVALSANAVATAAGATAAFAAQQVPGDPTSLARGAAAAAKMTTLGSINAGLIVATGLGQAAALNSSSGGGGGLGGGGGQTQQDQAQDFQPETASLQVSDANEGGSRAFNVTLPDSDDLGKALAEWLNKATQEGQI